MRVGILASHPIQYQAPWFRALAKELDLQVYFAHRQTADDQARAGFGVAFEWDIDLLAGYRSQYLHNVAKYPNVNQYSGCDTPEIAEIISRENFDAFIVCGWYLKSFLQASRACCRIGVPVLVRGDSQLLTPRSKLRTWAKKVTHRFLLRRFTGFLVVGKRNAEYLRYYGVSEDRIFFAPHFVDKEWFASRAEAGRVQRSQQRGSWEADVDSIVVLFVGKFIHEKRPQDLLRALRGWPPGKVLCVLVGSGELEKELRDLARQLSVRTRFEGFKNQSDLPLYYVSSDVLVLPSESESWGLVVNEAFACGLPAIVSNAVGCASDMIDEGETGFVFPTGDTQALSERLALIANLKAAFHDWRPALDMKTVQYSVESAVTGTLAALKTLARSSSGKKHND